MSTVTPVRKLARLDYGLVVSPAIGTVLMLVVWQVLTGPLGWGGALIPTPLEVFAAPSGKWALIFSNMRYTVFAGLIGFFWAVIAAVLIAMIINSSDYMRRSLMPLLIGGNTIPRITFAPLIIFYIGDFQAQYLISAWVAFFPMLVNTIEGFDSTSSELEYLLDSLDATIVQKYKYIYIQNSLPMIFDGMKVTVQLAMVGAVVGEFIVGEQGIGYIVLLVMGNYNAALALALMGLMGFVTLLLFFLIFLVQDTVVFWEHSTLLPEGQQ